MRNYARAAIIAIAAAFLSSCSSGGGNTLAPPSTNTSSIVSVSNPTASSSHSPPPSQAPSRGLTANQYGPAHAPTFEQVVGNYRTSQSGWNTVGKYVNYIETDKRAAPYAANAGMKAGIYTDVIKIPVANAYEYPESAFAHTCDNQRVYTASSGTPAYLGNPGSPTLLTTWNAQIQSMLQDQWGTYPFRWVLSDDSDNPGLLWNLSLFLIGGQNGSVSPGVFCGFNTTTFADQISNMMQNANLPVIFNDDTDPQYYGYMNGKPNIIGGECEGCIASPFLGNGQTKVTGSTWLTQMNTGLINITNQKIFFLSAMGGVPADTLGYTYASYMLMYDQNYTLFRQDNPSNSGLGMPPTAEIVPTQPLISTPSNISVLNYNGGGVYAREYAACYINGQYAGPCAALVNPDTVAHGWPWLSREYHHLLQFGGNGIVTEFGDTGYANADGPHPGTNLSAGGWAIAFN